MAKRKYTDDHGPLSSPEIDDDTFPNAQESELLAAADQYEAEMNGEANPPPPPVEAEEASPPVLVEGDGKPKVKLSVFIASGGIRWDQMAGFKSHAQRQKMGPLSIPEWREAFNSFMKRPVR